MTHRARAPKVGSIRWADTLPSNFESTVEAAVADCISSFRKTVGLVDGTRSAQVAEWAAELERVASKDEEVAA